MVRIAEGRLDGTGKRIGIVVSRFNQTITERLFDGAVDCLLRHGTEKEKIDAVRVPGAFEIAPAAKKLCDTGQYDAVICLGAVIRGQTPHFDFVAAEVTRAVGALAATGGDVVSFGVLTTDTFEQASDRAGGKAGNKGWDAALAALEMANLPIGETGSWE